MDYIISKNMTIIHYMFIRADLLVGTTCRLILSLLWRLLASASDVGSEYQRINLKPYCNGTAGGPITLSVT
jgi:hypothetical protein